MARQRKQLGSAGGTHLAQAKEAMRMARLDADRIPPTCEGGIRLLSRALVANAEARVHLWALPPALRKKHSKLIGDTNILDKKLREQLEDASVRCKGNIQ